MSRIADVQSSRIQNFLKFQKDPLSFFVAMLNQGDVLSLKTGLRPSYIVNSPAFVQEILVSKESSFRKGRTSEVLQRTIGDGLLTAEKASHERQKKYMQPVFYKERLQQYALTIIEETEKVAQRLRNVSTCSLHDEMMQLTLAIITRTMFATDVEQTKRELAHAVSETIEQTARSLFAPIPLPYALPTRGHRTQKRAVKKLEQMIFQTIEQARHHPESYRLTMLGLLLDTTDEQGIPIGDEEIRDQMMTMLLAGHETSANLLTWIIYELSREGRVEAGFFSEIDALNGWDTPIDLIRAMPYTNQIIQEGLRLYPPAWLIYRETSEDVELLGDRFVKGSTFMISPYAMHRNPSIFNEPERFWPERFDGNAMSSWPKFAYYPFGGGSRSCIGSRFATMEVALILAVLGRHVQFRQADDRPVIAEPLVSLRIKGGIQMRVQPRTVH